MVAARALGARRATPSAIPSRVGIVGWSHGGLIALIAAFDHPDEFQAAYAGVPVSDLVARLGYQTEEYRRLFSAPYHIGKPRRRGGRRVPSPLAGHARREAARAAARPHHDERPRRQRAGGAEPDHARCARRARASSTRCTTTRPAATASTGWTPRSRASPAPRSIASWPGTCARRCKRTPQGRGPGAPRHSRSSRPGARYLLRVCLQRCLQRTGGSARFLKLKRPASCARGRRCAAEVSG